jgi:hypothetical protein
MFGDESCRIATPDGNTTLIFDIEPPMTASKQDWKAWTLVAMYLTRTLWQETQLFVSAMSPGRM